MTSPSTDLPESHASELVGLMRRMGAAKTKEAKMEVFRDGQMDIRMVGLANGFTEEEMDAILSPIECEYEESIS